MLPIIFALSLIASDAYETLPAPRPCPATGVWEGDLEIQIPLMLRFTFETRRGDLHGTFESPDQVSQGFPVAKLEVTGTKVRAPVPLVGGTFEGEVSADGNTLAGIWKQGADMKLTLKRVAAPSTRLRPQLPKAPFPYREIEVTVETKSKLKLAGTLTLPPGDGPFPAVSLISGSGPQDRDSTLMFHKPFRLWADYLTRRGVAVLRCDDRGTGKSGGLHHVATSADFADDAEACLDFLKGRKEIDAKKVGLIGHSEGGIVGPMVAARRPDVAFVVMLAGTGIDGGEVLVSQSKAMAALRGAKPRELEILEQFQRAAVAAVRKEGDRPAILKLLRQAVEALPEADRKEGVDALMKDLAPLAAVLATPWQSYFIKLDPRDHLRKVKVPVLAIIGEKDVQVLPKANLPEIEKALKVGGNADVTVKELPGLNHLFQPCQTGGLSEYARIETTVDPGVLKLVGDWIEKRVK